MHKNSIGDSFIFGDIRRVLSPAGDRKARTPSATLVTLLFGMI